MTTLAVEDNRNHQIAYINWTRFFLATSDSGLQELKIFWMNSNGFYDIISSPVWFLQMADGVLCAMDK